MMGEATRLGPQIIILTKAMNPLQRRKKENLLDFTTLLIWYIN